MAPKKPAKPSTGKIALPPGRRTRPAAQKPVRKPRK